MLSCPTKNFGQELLLELWQLDSIEQKLTIKKLNVEYEIFRALCITLVQYKSKYICFEKLHMEWAALSVLKNENVLVNIYLIQIV